MAERSVVTDDMLKVYKVGKALAYIRLLKCLINMQNE